MLSRLVYCPVLLVVFFGIIVTDANSQGLVTAQTSQSSTLRGVTLDMKDATLEQVLSEIAHQANMRLVYNDAAVSLSRRTTVRVVNMNIGNALATVLKNTGLEAAFAHDGSTIVVTKRDAQNVKGLQGVLAGRVLDAKTGKGIAGANVTIKPNDKGVVTDEDGSYRLTGISSGPHTITVRLVGYAKQTRQVSIEDGITATADFKLEPSASVLDQVIVTGTVVASELRSVPNAITVITAKQIEERGITRIDQLFRGDIPGLFSLNKGSETVLDEVTMFSRGATALSLISAGTNRGTNPIKTYIDGVEMADSKYLNQIDPSSIERIEILAGPQASTIYGANAINGVMQIFTKRGTGTKPQLTLNFNSGIVQNNFSSALAPNHLADAGITGIEGRISYNIGGSWSYEGSWTPGKQTQRLSAYGGSRMEWGKLSVDGSVRRGLTRNRERGGLEQSTTYLRATGAWSPNASNGVPGPQTSTLYGNTFGLSIGYRPLSWWSHEAGLGSDATNVESFRTAPTFTSRADTILEINNGLIARRSEHYNSVLQASISSFARLNLTFGGDHWGTRESYWSAFPLSLTGSFSSADGVNVERRKPFKNTGAFIQGQLAMMDALFLTYGIRMDWNPNFGDDAKVKPGRYGISYTRDIETPLGAMSAKLRGSYGRAIRPPRPDIALAIPATLALGSTSPILDQFGLFDWQLANPDLGPEYQQGGEGGVELYLGSRGSLVITRFNQTVDNLISSVSPVDSVRSLAPEPIPDANFACSPFRDDEDHCYYYQSQYLNVGSIRNQGWELQGSVNLGPLTTRGTYSWVKSRVTGITPRYRTLLSGSDFEPGRPFDYIPEHTWAFGVAYAHSSNTVSLSVNGIGMRYVNLNALGLSASNFSRFQQIRPRMQNLSQIYRPLGAGYATADLNATHQFSSRVDATFQVNNLTDYYQNDYNASFATIGRQTKLGLRWRTN